MTVRLNSLQTSRLISANKIPEEDPMASMGNLMDVMLVFACALMIALIAHYNVNLVPSDPVVSDYERFEGELIDASLGEGENGDSSFIAIGMVFEDSETGELYVVRTDDEQ